jgi:hypothetical protein
VLALGRWGSDQEFGAEADVFGADSTVLALKTLFDAEAAGALEADVELRLLDQAYTASVRGGRFSVTRGAGEATDAVIESDPVTLAGALWHGAGLSHALSGGALRLSGDRGLAERFLALFPLPRSEPDGRSAGSGPAGIGPVPPDPGNRP